MPEVEATFQTSRRHSVPPIFLLTCSQEKGSSLTQTQVTSGLEESCQIQDGWERVIVYYSKTLNKEERSYCVTQQELLAIVRMLEHLHEYL
jgi:hypothetical protein